MVGERAKLVIASYPGVTGEIMVEDEKIHASE
jgi:hypothetical protein